MDECSVVIDDIEYPIHKEVLDLIVLTSKERDYYRDVTHISDMYYS